MPNVVLVIDMTRAFMEKGRALYCGDEARHIIPHIQALLEKEIKIGAKVLFLNDHHDRDDLEFRMFPPHAIEGTEETAIVPELADFPGEVIPKKRYSAFYGTTLGTRLTQLRPDRIIVTGVCTDICVCHTVGDARDRDYEVEVPVNCVASFDEEAHRFALEHMEKVLGAHLV